MERKIPSIKRYSESDEYRQLERRESMFMRNDYPGEQRLMALVRGGEIEKLDEVMRGFWNADILVGNMSGDNTRLVQYMCVIFISLAEREAINAGVSEAKSFDTGDAAMIRIDRSADVAEMFSTALECVRSLTMLVRDYNESRKLTPAIRQCLEYIDVHAHTQISLDELAAVAGLSRVYLSKLFGAEMGMSIPQYVNELRLEEAAQLLKQTKESAASIANLVGFNSQSYFIMHFKAKYGATPGEYRKQFYN